MSEQSAPDSSTDTEKAEGSELDNEFVHLIERRVENLRPKLLDLTRRNPLISTRFSARSTSYIRVVDELPDVLSFQLSNGGRMRLVPLPPLEEDPKDEQSREFQELLANALLTDGQYLDAAEAIDTQTAEGLDKLRTIERELKDRVRAAAGLSPRQKRQDLSLIQHAKNNGILPSYDLPLPSDEHEDGRHSDNLIQTLLLPDELSRKMTGLETKCRTWQQETGINVLSGAFGYLDWKEPPRNEQVLSPILLMPLAVKKEKTGEGPAFYVSGFGDGAELNEVLVEKFKRDFDVEMPAFEGGSIEAYLQQVQEAAPKHFPWKVRRQAAIGVFPSARMAMFRDLSEKEVFSGSEIVSTLLGGSGADAASPFADDYHVDEPEYESKVAFTVLDADSSQFSTLVDVADGRNVAVEGPPGTGKSQTIVNAIANAIGEGKKVLFVAEKLAALNVVKSRLEALGLGEFVLPLQADRSNKQAVVQSIRRRLEKEPEAGVPKNSTKAKKLRAARSSIAEYLSLLTQKFGETGLSIYEVLGRSIRSSCWLEGLSGDFLSPKIPDLLRLDELRLEEMLAAAGRVQECWSASNKAKANWKGLRKTRLNAFEVDQLCESASTISEYFARAASDASELSKFGFRDRLDEDELDSLVAVMAMAAEGDPRLNEKFVAKVVTDLDMEAIRELISARFRFNKLSAQIDGALCNPVSTLVMAELEKLVDLCKLLRLPRPSLEAARELDRRLEKQISAVQGIFESLQKLITQEPAAKSWSLGVLQRAKALVESAEPDALSLRRKELADPSLALAVANTAERGIELVEQRKKLRDIIDVSQSLDADDLRDIRALIADAGIFKSLSGKYRRARREAMKLSMRPKYSDSDAVDDLRQLISYKQDEKAFLDDPRLPDLFGMHYRRLETDFRAHFELCKYLARIETEFSGPENLQIRELLRERNLDLLERLTLPEGIPGDLTFESLERRVGLYKRKRAALRENVATLKNYERGIRAPNELTLEQLEGLVNAGNELVQTNIVLERHAELEREVVVFKPMFKGNPREVERELQVAERIQREEYLRPHIVSILERGNSAEVLAVAECAVGSARRAQEASSAFVIETGVRVFPPIETGRFSELGDRFRDLAHDAPGLRAHSDLATAEEELRASGVGWVFEQLRGEDHRIRDFVSIMDAAISRAMAISVYQDHGRLLARYRGADLDALREVVAETDRQLLELARGQLSNKLLEDAQPPGGNGQGRKSDYTEMALIYNEVNKKKRHISVRDLVSRASRALLELKPCWMMSPLSVAQYVQKGAIDFDLCIIDEASQMRPEDALGALVRSRQAMVVGDTNQLPPTDFFRKMLDDDEDDEDEMVLEESVLQMANVSFRPGRRLRWHYRSKHSSLIQFSNQHVYGGDLVVFPSANETDPKRGVSLVAVGGSYNAGTNPIEAKAMVDAALQFMRANPRRSLGLVTLNQKQRDLVIDEMEFALGQDSAASDYVAYWQEASDGLETFFIKNLENVQGDERDVIFVGTVYGPSEPGRPVMQRFGPINGTAGKRRLNVLFSRAKEQIVTFSSMSASDITADEHGNAGAYMLKCWLEYAAGGLLEARGSAAREPDSDFEIFVMEQLQSMGFETTPQVGAAGYFIDIGVKHPSWPYGYVLAVECDGANYHSSKSARDRDRLRQEVLEGLGWRFHRIWSTDWFNDPRGEVEKLRNVLEARLSELQASITDDYSKSNITPKAHEIEGVAFPHDGFDTRGPTELPKPNPLNDSQTSLDLANGDEAEGEVREGDAGAAVGDCVMVRFLSEGNKVLRVCLSDSQNDPDRGVVHISRPLGSALIGAEAGEEVEVLVGDFVRTAVVEEVVKAGEPT